MGLYLVLVVLSSYLLLTKVAQGNILDYDCVDVYKQPAFQHPLLKHHKIQEKFILGERIDNENKSKISYQICPKGTVPISKQKNETSNVDVNNVEYFGQHYAVIRMVNDGRIYRGAQADISVHNLTIQNNQSSKSHIWLENGPRNQLNSIQFGWAIHSRLYGDSLTRLKIYWTADGYQRTGCYNTNCPGFVLVSRVPLLGVMIDSFSNFKPIVWQDANTGHWTLKAFNEIIGYWPKELFTHLNKRATLVHFGGNTFLSPDGTSPPMGNGHFPTKDLQKDSHQSDLKIMTWNYRLIDVEDKNVKIYSGSDRCYNIIYWLYTKLNGASFSYGGPGGKCGN